MAINFEKYAAKGNEFLHILAEKLGNRDDEGRAARVLRSVFRVLRNHFTPEESIDFLSQLPMALKGIYVDGWKPGRPPARMKTLDDFAAAVMRENMASERDFEDYEDVIKCTRALVETLQLFVSRQELEDAFGTLPEAIKKTFSSWVAEKHLL